MDSNSELNYLDTHNQKNRICNFKNVTYISILFASFAFGLSSMIVGAIYKSNNCSSKKHLLTLEEWIVFFCSVQTFSLLITIIIITFYFISKTFRKSSTNRSFFSAALIYFYLLVNVFGMIVGVVEIIRQSIDCLSENVIICIFSTICLVIGILNPIVIVGLRETIEEHFY